MGPCRRERQRLWVSGHTEPPRKRASAAREKAGVRGSPLEVRHGVAFLSPYGSDDDDDNTLHGVRLILYHVHPHL